MPKGEDFGFTIPEQIASHSSVLTNRRIDIILQKIDYWKEESWARPCVPNVERYFANLYSLFDNVFVVLNQNEIEEIVRCFAKYWELKNTLQNKENQNLKNVYGMLFICDNLNRIMKAGLQKYEYFFRIGTRDVHRIEDGLKIIHAGGGIFGKVSRVPSNADKPESEKH